MPTILTITAAEVLAIARLDPANTTDVADVNEVITREQEAVEIRLSPLAIRDGALIPFITRMVAKLLAAEVLAMRGREEGASGNFQGAGITISGVPHHPALLREEAWLALDPYRRRVSLATTPAGQSPVSVEIQQRLFGPGEGITDE